MSSTRVIKVKTAQQMVALLVGLMMTVTLATGFVWAHKQVLITADGRSSSVHTLYNNPKDVLAQAGVVMGGKDEYRVSTETLVTGSTIEVYRAVPVTVVYQGESEVITTGMPTVGEVAASLGILRDDIRLMPDETAKVKAGMQIIATTMSEELVESQVVEPLTVIRVPDATLEKGVENVIDEGQDGVKTVSVRMHYADGVLVSEEFVEQKITEAPTPRRIQVGTRDTVETSRGAMRFRRVEYMEATAYLPTDGSSQGITATGIPARHGIVAVDPRVIPMGTRVYIEGYGLALAADVGGAIRGERIDLCMEGYTEAINFGRRMVKVYVLD